MHKPKTIHSEESARLCKWLDKQRQEREVSIGQLALNLKWSKAIVGKIFVGDRRLDVVEYVQICQALGVDACEGLGVISRKR